MTHPLKPDLAYIEKRMRGVPSTLRPRIVQTASRKCLALQVAKTPPLEHLPDLLWPKDGQAIQPPTMLYGFPVPREALLRYAKEHDLLIHNNSTDESEMVAVLSGSRAPPKQGNVNVAATMDKTFGNITRQLGLKRPRYGLTTDMALNYDGPAYTIIILYTNYDGYDALSVDDVNKVVTFMESLGAHVEPKWYVCMNNFYWRITKAGQTILRHRV